MAADLRSAGQGLAPGRVHIVGVVPQGAARGIDRLAVVNSLGDVERLGPGLGVTRPVAAAVAPPGELTTVAALLATLTDDGAGPIGEAVVLDPVQHDVADRDLAGHRLAARLVIDIERQALDLRNQDTGGTESLAAGRRRPGEDADGGDRQHQTLGRFSQHLRYPAGVLVSPVLVLGPPRLLCARVSMASERANASKKRIKSQSTFCSI